MTLDLSAFSSPERSSPDDAIFISIEGIEGAGKSTQIQLLKNHLENKNYQVMLMREPGGTNTGEKLREVILQSKESLTPLTEALIFVASRSELLTQKILPLLKQKKTVVILDRYIDSSLSYQGAGRKLGFETLLKLHSIAPLNTLPHKTFFLHIDEKTSRARQASRGDELDYFEKEKSDFYQAIKQGFDELLEIFPKRIVKIDASGSVEDVHQLIISKWEKYFPC